MAGEGRKDPSPTVTSRTVNVLFNKVTAGVLGAGIAARYGPELIQALSPVDVPNWQAVAGCGTLGFGAGVTAMATLQSARRIAIKQLLTNKTWITDQKSMKTKVWAVLLRLLVGPQPHSLYEFQALLPKLPLPEVEDTCRRYLATLEPLLTPEELEHTRGLLETFKRNEAPVLQNYLRQRSKKLQSWLADWWLLQAYLTRRESIAIDVNFYMMSSTAPQLSRNGLARLSNFAEALLQYYEMVDQKTLPPDMILNMVPVCMDSVRYMFASSRIPGEHVDSLVITEHSKHIVILRRGEYFRLDMYAPDGRGREKRLTKKEIRQQLQLIQDATRDVSDVNKIAALTTQKRNTWARHRQMLMKSATNSASLKDIEEAIFMISLGDTEPRDVSHQAKMTLAGTGADRWFDKCLTADCFGNTTMGGTNMEHSGADASHFAIMFEHVLQDDEYGPDGDLMDKPGEVCRHLAPPMRLNWELDAEMQEIIEAAYGDYLKRIDDLDIIVTGSEFGKKWMKSAKISPDGFIQMAIQLAYWRLHRRVSKTYEPASHRLFALGRTDNINPVSSASYSFVRVMERPDASDAEKIASLRQAVSYQSHVRLECTAGGGCERHLLGLQCAARELGMDMPEIFSDKAYNLPTLLSTSQVPTNIGSLSGFLPESIAGGFGPMHKEGYGLLYCSVGDNMFNFNITSWRKCKETDSQKLAAGIMAAMMDMRKVLESSNA